MDHGERKMMFLLFYSPQSITTIKINDSTYLLLLGTYSVNIKCRQ